jgi:hypothetical protein
LEHPEGCLQILLGFLGFLAVAVVEVEAADTEAAGEADGLGKKPFQLLTSDAGTLEGG